MIDFKKLAGDPYQDIYDEVEAHVNYVDRAELFSYCLEVCEKIFSVAEGSFGKGPLNLPEGFLHEIAFELLEFRKTRVESQRDMLRKYECHKTYAVYEKYGADCQYNFGQKFVSLHNLYNMLNGDYDENSESQPKRKIEYICTTYLPAIFGLKYSQADENKVKFEKLRLILILYFFRENMGFDLGYLMGNASIKSVGLSPKYKKGIIYIKEMIGKRCSFEDIMNFERWVRSEYNFIQLLDFEIVNIALKKFDVVNCSVTRTVMKKIYVLLCERLTSLLKMNKKELQHPLPIEVHAYIFFSEKMLLEDMELNDMDQVKWLDVNPAIYGWINAIQEKNNQTELEVDFHVLKKFLQQNKHSIASLISDSEHKSKNKDRRRILEETSIRDYILMIRLYQLTFSIEMQKRETIKIENLLLLIFLYEGCKRYKVDFGSIDKLENSRRKTIHSVFLKLQNDDLDTGFLLENHKYGKIIRWLMHKIFVLKTCRTPEIVVLENQVQKHVRDFWHNNIAILEREQLKGKYNCVADICREIISEADIEKIKQEIEAR